MSLSTVSKPFLVCPCHTSHRETKLILYEKFSCLVVWLIPLPRGRRRRNAKQFLGEFDGLKCCRRRDSAVSCVACRHRGHCRYLYTQHIILTIQSGHAAHIIQLQPYTCSTPGNALNVKCRSTQSPTGGDTST